jgi:hypothetical protein
MSLKLAFIAFNYGNFFSCDKKEFLMTINPLELLGMGQYRYFDLPS